MQKTLYRFFGYFFHISSTKARWGTIFLFFEIFCRKRTSSFFWTRLTGEGTSEVMSGTSGDHLLVTSASKKSQAFWIGWRLEPLKKLLVFIDVWDQKNRLGWFSCCFLLCPVALILTFSCGGGNPLCFKNPFQKVDYIS